MGRKSRQSERGGGRGPGRAPVSYPFEVRREVVRELVERKATLGVVSKTFNIAEMTIRNWLVAYQLGGEEALLPKRRGSERQPRDEADPVVRAVMALKQEHPEYGARRIQDLVRRFEALGVSASTVQRILVDMGMATPPAAGPVARGETPPRRFERAAPNQLWQSDIFTFLLRRHERLYLTAFMDDHSRFIVSFVLAHHQKGSLVLEALERGIAAYGTPQEVLTDQGRQYTAWRGETLFEERLRQYGIRHVKSRPQHPETLGKIERFWKTLWEEFLSRTVFSDFADCQRRLALFVEGYNFQRPHQALSGLVPADRYFRAAPQVRAAIEKNIEANALRRAQQQPVQKPFYLVGRLGDRDLSIAADGPGLRVRFGNEEPQTITLPKERTDDEPQVPNRLRTHEAGDAPSPDANLAAYEQRPEPDRAAPLPAAVERALGREVGDRRDLRDAGVAGHLLPAGDEGPRGDALGADPWSGERDPGRSGTAPRLGREGEEAGAGEAAVGAAALPDATGSEAGAGEARPWEAGHATTEGSTPFGVEASVVELDPDTAARLEQAFDPDEGWRERAELWERKLTGASAPVGSLPAEASDDSEKEVRAGASGAGGDDGTLLGAAGGPFRAAHGERGSEAAVHEPQPLPDALAPGREGDAGGGDAEAGGPAGPSREGDGIGAGGPAPARGERAAPGAGRDGGAALGVGGGLGAGEVWDPGPAGTDPEDEDPEQ